VAAVAPTTPGAAAGRSCGAAGAATGTTPPPASLRCYTNIIINPGRPGHGSADQNGKKKIGKTSFAPVIQETARLRGGRQGAAKRREHLWRRMPNATRIHQICPPCMGGSGQSTQVTSPYWPPEVGSKAI